MMLKMVDGERECSGVQKLVCIKPYAKAPFILHVIRVSFSTLIIKKFIIPAGILPWTFSWTEVWDNILGVR